MEKSNYSTIEASKYLNEKGIYFSPKTLTIWRALGKGPRYKKVEWKVYYEKQDLDEFICGNKVDTKDSIEKRFKKLFEAKKLIRELKK